MTPSRFPTFRVTDEQARAGVLCVCLTCRAPFLSAEAYVAHACVPIGGK